MSRVHAKHTDGIAARAQDTLFRLLFPNNCVGCGRIADRPFLPLCVTCGALLEHPSPTDIRVVLRETIAESELPPASALWFYRHESPVPKLHRLMKYHGSYRLGVLLGSLLAERLRMDAIDDHPEPDDARVIVPIPLHPIRFRDRGFNQAESIARGVGQALRLPVLENALIRARFSSSQVGKGREDRMSDLHGSFVLNPKNMPDADVILVDDVITTGATMLAALDALRQGGILTRRIAALAISTPQT